MARIPDLTFDISESILPHVRPIHFISSMVTTHVQLDSSRPVSFHCYCLRLVYILCIYIYIQREDATGELTHDRIEHTYYMPSRKRRFHGPRDLQSHNLNLNSMQHSFLLSSHTSLSRPRACMGIKIQHGRGTVVPKLRTG